MIDVMFGMSVRHSHSDDKWGSAALLALMSCMASVQRIEATLHKEGEAHYYIIERSGFAYFIGFTGGWCTASNFVNLGTKSLPNLMKAPLFPI